METSLAFFTELFLHSLSMWWVIVPSILLGFIVGAIPGFSAANTIIILLPFTLVMDVEVGLVFMVSLYCASRMGAGIPAILVNIPGTAGAAATPLDGYPMVKQARQTPFEGRFICQEIAGIKRAGAHPLALQEPGQQAGTQAVAHAQDLLRFGLRRLAIGHGPA